MKKSVTIPRSLAEQIESRTGARGFSRFITEAAAQALALQKAQEIVEDHVARKGDFTPEEIEEARGVWHGSDGR
ncbi:hypothetical protein BKD26_32170 [Streptomyces sp. CB03238]|nr:hypothetical protein BKD26_32170 [Streptomyces sp. CB03238]